MCISCHTDKNSYYQKESAESGDQCSHTDYSRTEAQKGSVMLSVVGLSEMFVISETVRIVVLRWFRVCALFSGTTLSQHEWVGGSVTRAVAGCD